MCKPGPFYFVGYFFVGFNFIFKKYLINLDAEGDWLIAYAELMVTLMIAVTNPILFAGALYMELVLYINSFINYLRTK